jgi:hypothetical protein
VRLADLRSAFQDEHQTRIRLGISNSLSEGERG